MCCRQNLIYNCYALIASKNLDVHFLQVLKKDKQPFWYDYNASNHHIHVYERESQKISKKLLKIFAIF